MSKNLMDNLTNSDKQALQSAINQTVHKLKEKRSALAVQHSTGVIPHAKWESGRQKLSEKIAQLHGIKHKLGIWEGYSQQPGSPYRDEPALPETILTLDFAEVERRVLASLMPVEVVETLEIIVWEGEGGSYV